MAKSQNRQVDKVERQARLANVRRHQELEQRELRNSNRLGWHGSMTNTDDEDEQWSSNET